MKSSRVAPDQTATANQYNFLRQDAYGGSMLLPRAQTSPDMTVHIESGVFYIGGTRIIFAGGNTSAMVAPVSNPRIDLVTINASGTISVTTGSENASPVAPTYPTDGSIAICEIYHRVGELSVQDLDDTVNAYIYNDVRVFLTNGNRFKSRARYTATLTLQQVTGGNDYPIDFDTQDYDDNSEFDNTQKTGTNSSTSASHLVDTGANQFVAGDVGRWVYNASTKRYAKITAYNSASDITLSADIFTSGGGSGIAYRIFGYRFTAKVAGYYQFNVKGILNTMADNENFILKIFKNGSAVNPMSVIPYSSGAAQPLYGMLSDIVKLAVGDYIEFIIENNSVSTQTVGANSFFSIALMSPL